MENTSGISANRDISSPVIAGLAPSLSATSGIPARAPKVAACSSCAITMMITESANQPIEAKRRIAQANAPHWPDSSSALDLRARPVTIAATSVTGVTFTATTAAPETTAAPTTAAAVDTTTPAPETTAGAVDYQWTPNADIAAKAEGQVNIIAWAGYAEDGSTDPAYDWVTPFEKLTSCQVNVKTGATSDEMVQLMQSGEYDGVSASGDATQRLMSGGEVVQIDPAEYPSYTDIFEGLKLQPWNSQGGVPFGIPHGRGANLLVYNTEAFADAAPDSWGVMFEAGSPADGAVSVYDSPIYIADAALYLMATQPDLGITNPYALDQAQFDAAVALLEQQAALTSQYWADYTVQQASLENGDVLAGTTWQVIVNLAQANGAKIDAVKPVEGATGWSDTWMLSSKAANPNCMKL